MESGHWTKNHGALSGIRLGYCGSGRHVLLHGCDVCRARGIGGECLSVFSGVLRPVVETHRALLVANPSLRRSRRLGRSLRILPCCRPSFGRGSDIAGNVHRPIRELYSRLFGRSGPGLLACKISQPLATTSKHSPHPSAIRASSSLITSPATLQTPLAPAIFTHEITSSHQTNKTFSTPSPHPQALSSLLPLMIW